MATVGRNNNGTRIITRKGIFESQAAYDAIYGIKKAPEPVITDFIKVIDGKIVVNSDVTLNGNLTTGSITNTIIGDIQDTIAETNPDVWSKDDAIPTTIGGIASGTVGQTLDGLTAIQILEKLLYPYQILSFSGFSVGLPISQTVEVGTTSGAGPYTSTWGFNNGSNLTANSISITGLTSLASSLSGTTSSVTHPVYSYNTPTNLTFTISANQTTGGAATRTQTYSWRKKIWYGKSNLTALTQYSDFSSFSSIFTQNLTSVSSANYSFAATPSDDQYAYIIIPADSSYSKIIDNDTSFPFAYLSPVNITIVNSLGVSLPYKYYRSSTAHTSALILAAGV